ncbi:MAG: hypothetical protein ACHQQQ_08710 [Bacteroidota bacterium]
MRWEKEHRSPAQKKINPVIITMADSITQCVKRNGGTFIRTTLFEKNRRVDDKGRILLEVDLIKNASRSDTLPIILKIKSIGGSIHHIPEAIIGHPTIIVCWLPYNHLEEIALLPNVQAVTSLPDYSLE